MFIDKRDLWKI